MTWKIGDIVINGRVVLASMSKITDLPFRLLCRKLGANLAFTEMVNCNAVSRGNKAAKRLFCTVPDDLPLGIQLFGSRPDKFLKTVRTIPHLKVGHFFEVNFSCPDRLVLDQGAGAALLRRPKRMKDIISCLVTEQSLPVAAKIRLPSNDVNKAVKIARHLDKCGVSAITVHARTITQKNSGPPILNVIRAIQKEVSIPVLGNGGVDNYNRFERTLKISDAVMIGKAAIYHPGLFGQLKKDWQTFSAENRLSWLNTYHDYAVSYDLLNPTRLLQRAKDFLRFYIPIKDINQMYNKSYDMKGFIVQLQNRIIGDP